MRDIFALIMLIAILGTSLMLFRPGSKIGAEPLGQAPPEEQARLRMVETQIRARGISDTAVLGAMARVPRHRFVPLEYRRRAYDDTPLPIGSGQTISQPYIVAYMTEALDLEATHTVLEIGTGSGYQAAVLAEIVREVHSIEIVPELAALAEEALQAAGYDNVRIRTGNGYAGWPEQAPFDRIIVTAAPPTVPPALVEQLAIGGVMVLPVGTRSQEIQILRKSTDGITTETTIPVRFVPMVDKGK